MSVEGGTVQVLELYGDDVELAFRASRRTYLVVRGALRNQRFAVNYVAALSAEEARQRGLLS